MAAGTPVTIGNATPAAGLATTITFTTTAVVPSGAVVVICAGFGGVTNTVSGGTAGGLTLTIGSQGPTNTDQFNSVLWADAPSGLASGSTVTVNITGTGGSSRYCQGSYVTGLSTGGPSAIATADSTTGAPWATGSVSVPTGDILIGSCMGGTTSTTNTPSGGNSEIIPEQTIAADSAFVSEYQIGVGTSIALSGTWGTSERHVANAIVFAQLPAGIQKAGAGIIGP